VPGSFCGFVVEEGVSARLITQVCFVGGSWNAHSETNDKHPEKVYFLHVAGGHSLWKITYSPKQVT
jgi:hypothetical protein